MKHLIVPILLILLGCKNHDTVSIEGHILGEFPEKIGFSRPIEGQWLFSTKDTVAINSLGNFKISLDTDIPSLVSLFVPKMGGVLLVEPGKDYHVQVDLESQKPTFRVLGATDTLQDLYNSFDLPEMGYGSSPLIKSIIGDSVPEQISTKLDSAFLRDKALFDGLLEDHLISKGAHNLAVADRRCYYYGMGALVCNMQLYDNPDTERPLFNYLSSLYDTLPVTSVDYLRSPWAYPYLKSYISYKEMESGTFDPIKQQERYDQGSPHRYHIDQAKKYLHGKPLKYYFAAYLVDNGYNNKDNSEELITLYEDFKRTYPNSEYILYITPEINPIIAFRKKLAKDSMNPKVRFVEDFEDVNTFNDLVAPFKGKKLFVDIWGTWCAPCKQEFEHKPALDSLLNTYAIEALYICEGRSSKEKTWKEMINFYDLEGHHVFTNKKLLANILDTFGKNGFGYPRYLLIDEHGEVAAPNAHAPSRIKALEKDIQSAFEITSAK